MENNKTLMVIGLISVLGVGGWMLSSNMSTTETKINNEVPVENTQEKSESKKMVEEKPKTIVDIAVESGDFKTLVTAVTEAELVETLSGKGPFTVFAPTDAAFAKIPEATLKAILADKDKLTSILTYHVVAGKVMAKDVVGLDSAKTVQGQELTIKVGADGSVMIGNAKVVTTDIEASNGVIHVIDTVLLPK